MLIRRQFLQAFPLVAGIYAIQGLTRGGDVLAQATAPTYSPQSQPVAAGEVDVNQLLLLLDADKNGKISRKEFMDFMAAEFDRLDADKSGELDVKELEKSRLTSARPGGTRR